MLPNKIGKKQLKQEKGKPKQGNCLKKNMIQNNNYISFLLHPTFFSFLCFQ